MRSIYKYAIRPEVQMPKGATIIHLGSQGNTIESIYVWALGDPKAARDIRSFIIRGTGDVVDDSAVHIGTVFQGSFVWHVFEVHA